MHFGKLLIFFAILTRVLSNFNNSFILELTYKISLICLILMIICILINVVMRSWVRFNDSIYKDESYLTHTLPVTKNEIYNSKFIQTLIFFIVSFIVIIISLFIGIYSKEILNYLKESINVITESIDFSTTFFITSILLLIFLELFNMLQSGYLGLILGNQKNNNKIAHSVAYGFVTYLITQIIPLLLVFVVGLFNNNVMNLFKNNTINSNILRLLMVLSIIMYLIIIIIMNIICKKELNKGVNVE